MAEVGLPGETVEGGREIGARQIRIVAQQMVAEFTPGEFGTQFRRVFSLMACPEEPEARKDLKRCDFAGDKVGG